MKYLNYQLILNTIEHVLGELQDSQINLKSECARKDIAKAIVDHLFNKY